MLNSPDSLRTHFNPAALVRVEGAPGVLPPLPAATFAVDALDRLLGWAASMPLFATNLAGVVTNLLERVLDGIAERAKEVLGCSLAASLADNTDVIDLMAREPAAGCLGDVHAFVSLKHMDNADARVAALQKMGMRWVINCVTCVTEALYRRHCSEGIVVNSQNILADLKSTKSYFCI